MERPIFEEINLVPVIEADFEFIFDLKCEENSVYWGGFSTKPDYDNLKQHYISLMADPAKHALLIRWKSVRVGIISFMIFDKTRCVDYSINVSYKFSGLGVAGLALRRNIEYLTEHIPACEKIEAWIREDNHRSQTVFRLCGFVETADCKEKYMDSDRKLGLLRAWVRPLTQVCKQTS